MIDPDTELHELLSLLHEGMISPSQEARLAELLRRDESAIRAYIRSSALRADLRGRLVSASLPDGLPPQTDHNEPGFAASEQAPANAEGHPQETVYGLVLATPSDESEIDTQAIAPLPIEARPASGRKRWLGYGAAAAVLAVCVSLVALLLPDRPHVATTGTTEPAPPAATEPATPTPPTALAVAATMTGASSVEWGRTSFAPQPNSELISGTTLELLAGSVELKSAGGVRLTIVGPARFTLIDAGRVDLHSGRLSAVVPRNAQGFTVGTERVDVVDLGTEFSVDVAPGAIVGVRVAAGQVQMQSPEAAGTPVRLSSGEAAVADATGIRIEQTPPAYAAVRAAGVAGGPSYPRVDKTNSDPVNVLVGSRQQWWAGDPLKDAWELTFDFGADTGLPAARVDYFSQRYMPKEAILAVSGDGRNWSPVGQLPNTNPAILNVGRSARYLKIQMSGKVADKQPAVWSVGFPSVADAEAARALTPGMPGVTKTWPAVVADVRYVSSADQSEQPALFYDPKSSGPVPLLVALHTWSSDYRTVEQDYARWCIDRGWAMIRPNFRGVNDRPEACGSDLAVADILSAVEFSKQRTKIDDSRVYLVGFSGGGHAALLMAGRHPEVWAGVSVWCPIYDLARWHGQTSRAGLKYAGMLESVCGGRPGLSGAVDAEYARRSPAAYMARAVGVPLDINAGIHDGHIGSVPVDHALSAYNALVKPADRIAEADIAAMVAARQPPVGMRSPDLDELYERFPILYRRTSGNARVTLFDGGHTMLPEAAFGWLEQQQKGTPALWKLIRTAVFAPSEPSQ